ncbi:BTB/POZ domain-containing protein [Aspergillus aculeatinus CBS 121060]|uniref:Uncharacterized protein n=1 Tax=Aspergillus aculeatinus CBS 121060 TaxID=1448322 RepID=A0ACD1GW49_9EURO|nr:hypothetical protein BO66DRAFT_442947 [Aspergillus aculeatinus CBS 121060]RAH65541.1 hypothetical protein BO66DRAFT_442947 [Aspergillus aculeatinus CBS 121060]
MSTPPDERQPQTATKDTFAETLLPLYHGPQVTIRLGSDGPTYMLSKALLCKKSTYFSKMFEGNCAEARSSFVTLQDDAITVKLTHDPFNVKPIFDFFIEWLYLGKLTLLEQGRSDRITCLLKLDLFVDRSLTCELTDLVAESIKQIIMEDPEFKKKREAPGLTKYCTLNVKCITTKHLRMAGLLRTGNAVRRVMVIALVEPYLRAQSLMSMLAVTIVQYPNLAFDLLTEVKKIMLAAVPRAGMIWITDPLTQIEAPLK